MSVCAHFYNKFVEHFLLRTHFRRVYFHCGPQSVFPLYYCGEHISMSCFDAILKMDKV